MRLLVLNNPRRPDLPPVAVEALASTGAWHLCIPERIRSQLALEALDSRDVTRADGTKTLVPYVGPIDVRFRNRVGCTGALVMGDRVVLGAIALADMDLVINPTTQTVEVNPESPNIGISWAKGTPHGVRAGTVLLRRSRPRRAGRVRSWLSGGGPEDGMLNVWDISAESADEVGR